MRPAVTSSAQAFFLNAGVGRRFCLYYDFADNLKCHGAILFVPPFGEEMNKSRRMMALQAQALAGQGYAVLLMDLYGCGDSDGELRDASWDGWKNDLAIACHWLRERSGVPVSLLGLRLGALLALDFLNDRDGPGDAIAQLVMWQAVLNGSQFLTQFFRLRLANEMLSGKSAPGGSTQAIRQTLLNGASVEIAGYEVPPQLALPIDALTAAQCPPPNCALHWIEVQSASELELPPARKKIADQWKQQHASFALTLCAGAEFWATPEISVCPELIALTCKIFTPAT